MELHTALFTVALWSGAAMGQGPPVCFSEGECTRSLYVNDWGVEDAQGCLEECRGDTNCQFFTFYSPEGEGGVLGQCLGLGNCEDFRELECSECWSGDRDCEDVTCFETGVRCSGVTVFDDAEREADSAEECLRECRDERDCAWFTFNEEDGACVLLEDCQSFLDCDTCTVGQDACSEPNGIPGDLTKLVVIGGYNLEDGDLDLVQVYDLSGDTPGDGLCNTLQFFPDSVQGASAALLEGGETIRVCGGGPIGSTACYDLSRSTLTWSPGPSLASPRYYSGSSVLGRGDWLISGGYDAGEDEDGDTSELLREGGSMFEAGPGLRYGMGFHCQAPLYDSSVLLASGEDGDQPYLLDVATGEEEGQSYMLSTRRLSVQCGVVRSEGAGVDVVAAGEGTSEIYSPNDGRWESGPDTPTYAYYYGLAQLEDTFLLVGGFDGAEGEELDAIVRFDPLTYQWETLRQRLDVPRRGAAAVAVPADWVECAEQD